jgi:glycosyltransferase involved in cell wall biosynthesis
MERSNLARLKALVAAGHECFLTSLNTHGDLLPILEQNRIPNDDLGYDKSKFRAFIRLWLLVRQHAHDALIFTGHNFLGTLALPSRRRMRQVLCVHFHHTGVKPLWFWRLYYRLAIKKFGCIFFNSSFIRDEAVALLPKLEEVSEVLPNIYELPALISAEDRATAREKLGISLDAVVIGNAGWLIPRKRFDLFIESIPYIKQQLPSACFMIAGDGQERRRLEQQAQKIGVAEDIQWLGWLKDIDTFYAAADLVLFNTDWDAVARTPIEAGVRGVAVVCSELHGGLHDLFDDPDWILSEHNPAVLANLGVDFLTNQKKRVLQTAEIRNSIASKCSPEVHVSRILGQISEK